jgi:hypothetical protein
MKYLIKRNDFLRGAKRLNEKSEFLRDAKISKNELYQELIKENEYASNHGSGPLANDIGWHDSLVGRFLNHIVRKVKVANNLRRIKPLITRLEGEFERIAAEGVVYKMDEEHKKLWFKLQLNNIFYELKAAIERGEEVLVIINITEASISSVNSFEEDEIGKELKATLLKELEGLLEELKKLNKEEEGEEGSEEGEEGSEEGEEGSEEGEEGSEGSEEGSEGSEEGSEEAYSKLESSLPTMIKNLSALYYILKNYKSVNLLNFNKKEEEDAKKPVPYVTVAGDTIELILKKDEGEVDKKGLTFSDANIDKIFAKNELELKPALDAANKNKTKKEKITLKPGLKLVLEKQGNSADGNNVYKEEDHLTQAFGKLKTDITALIDTKDAKLAISLEFIRILLEKHKDSKNDRLIMALYDNINKYLVGNKKQTIQEKDPLYKESYEYLMPKSEKNPNGGKIEVVAEKIARFAKRALQFDGKNLYGGLGELADPLKKFVETLKVLMKNPIVNVKPEYVKQKDEGDKENKKNKKASDKEIEKYKKDELIKDIERATRLALELKKDNPEKAAKIQASIDKKKEELDKLDESVNESVYISKYMEIQAGMRAIMLELNEALKNNSKPAGRLLKFDRFMSYIKEAEETPEENEENPDTEASSPRSTMTTSEKIQDYFDKSCMTVKSYTMEKTEMDKVKANFDKLEKDKDKFVIDGYDPIIEILKLFNRAYKLYMTKHITKRSTAPGVSTDAEYTSLDGEKGPYRNNKIFDTWENAVLDLMKNRKYQYIFDKDTVLRVGDEMRPNGGANLRKFMTDMLDGESLYKSKSGFSDAGRGKQADLLDKYFGAPNETDAAAVKAATTSQDVDENTAIAAAVIAAATNVKTTRFENAISGPAGNKAAFAIPNAFLILKIKNERGEQAQRSIFIHKIDGGYTYMQYSKSFGTFMGYYGKISYGSKIELVNGDIEPIKTRTETYYTKVKTDDFQKLLLGGGQISVGYLDNDGKENTEKITIEGSCWLTKESDGKQIVFDVIQTGAQIGTDSKKQGELKSAIENAGNKFGIVNLISGSSRSNIIINRV